VPVSSSARTFRPVLVVVAEIVSMMTSWLVSGLPRQFMEIWAKSRCSIRFHFEVPGGKWDTLISRPSSSASLASSAFRSRSRLPLEPPASAVISSLVASG
jgi:hypothetical protein